jgi:carbon dioxide concentrating mechanism protein CcmN
VAVPAQANHLPINGHTQGNVDVAPGVAMATGVVLGAAPGCRLVISPGTCLGADVIVQARHGDLVLEPGVSLGSGVLVVGHGSIGQHTCIGSNSTVINPRLGASQVVPPGSLVGDPSQSSETPAPAGSVGANGSRLNGSASNGSSLNGSIPKGSSLNGSSLNGNNSNGSSVYGKAQVNRLLATLFPDRQGLNGATPEDRS